METSFIAIHGIDGTGKTTATGYLVNHLRAIGRKAIGFDNIYIPQQDPMQPSRGLEVSLSKKAEQSGAIDKMLAEGYDVVKDRWLIDVFADNLHKGNELPDVIPEIATPDLSILLTCSELERQKRILQRKNATSDDLIPKEVGTRAHFFENYLLENIGDYASNVLQIDTTSMKVNEVVQIIVEKVQQ